MVHFSMRLFYVEFGQKTNLKAHSKLLKKRYIDYLSVKSSFNRPSKDQNMQVKFMCYKIKFLSIQRNFTVEHLLNKTDRKS